MLREPQSSLPTQTNGRYLIPTRFTNGIFSVLMRSFNKSRIYVICCFGRSENNDVTECQIT